MYPRRYYVIFSLRSTLPAVLSLVCAVTYSWSIKRFCFPFILFLFIYFFYFFFLIVTLSYVFLLLNMLLFKNLHRAVSIIIVLSVLVVIFAPTDTSRQVQAQDGGFELPVQLIGFPVIIMAVRMSNFVKKLAYSLNPNTYRRNVRRTRGVAVTEPPLNLAKADNELLQQLGPNFCVYEDVCLKHVKSSGTKNAMDWETIIRDYSHLPQNNQQYYLLSVFLGDIIGSAKLCQHFTETGRICH